MLDLDRIKQISAGKGVLEALAEKDYILEWLLWGISRISYLSRNLVFKGGTPLHKMYFLDWRFSEDLDFTTIQEIKEDDLNKNIDEMCAIVQRQSGIALNRRETGRSGEQDFDWAFEVNLEYIGPRRQYRGTLPLARLHITNDEILMAKPVRKVLLAPFEDLPTDFSTLTYPLEEILAEKLRTVLHQRCWPRDVYDVWRLLKEAKNFLDIEELLDIYSRKTIYRDFEPGIPDNLDDQILRLKNQWSQLERQVGEPPDFQVVYEQTKDLLDKLFREQSVIVKGGVAMLESRYSIKYKKGDLEIEVHGDKPFVEEKFNELLQKTKSEPKSIPSAPPSEKEPGKKPSLAEFLRSKGAKTHGDKILVFGYYLEKFEDEPSFNVDDIRECYSRARTVRTKNIPAYIGSLISQRYLMEGEQRKDAKKTWRLTDTGLMRVEALTAEPAAEEKT